jgi:flagellar hook-associated protein 1
MSLFAALRSSADALSVFERQLTVSSNNVANASTPGYVEQTLDLQALPIDPQTGLIGGVTGDQVTSARDVYAEQNVERETTTLGNWQQQGATLSPLQSSFDVTGQSGIPAALNQLYQSFTAWSTTPGDGTARQGVLNAAQVVAQAFNQQSTQLSQASADADTQLTSLVNQVNTLAKQLALDNTERSGTVTNAAVDANVYSTLEQLSSLVPVTALRQADGSLTVLLGGQTPLVVGQYHYDISPQIAVPSTPAPANPSGPPSASVLDASGKDITAEITGGQIGGLLYARNTVLASILGDSSQQGSLNQLAQSVADRVNGLLTSGNIDSGDPNAVPPVPATPGVPLFTYDATNPATVAQTFAVDPNVTPDQLAAIQPGTPADPGPPATAGTASVNNGIALQLANLATPQSAADEVNNLSYVQFYGNIAGDLGTAISTAQNNQSVQQGIVTQAQNLRQQSSGVSLDTEAINVLQFQRSYEAASKMVTILDGLTETVINMLSTT